MGTRNLTAVFVDGEYKVAQYGQWDGYLSAAGETLLSFVKKLRDDETALGRFRHNLGNCFFLNEEQRKQAYEGFTDADGWMTFDKSAAFQKTNVGKWITRDLGYDVADRILEAGLDEAIPLIDQIDFAKDSLFCEYAYVIDLDINTFEIYEGFNETPLESWERFYTEDEPEKTSLEDRYYPVKLLAAYEFLDSLPNDLTALGAKACVEYLDDAINPALRNHEELAEA